MLNLGSVIFLQVCQPHTNRCGYLEDFCDGLMLKEHPLFQLDKEALQIFLYYDDVEMCNPLGSKKTVHKLGEGLTSVQTRKDWYTNRHILQSYSTTTLEMYTQGTDPSCPAFA